MTCSYQALVLRVVNLIIEHDLGRSCGTIDNVYTGMHAVPDGFLPFEVHLHQGSEITVVEIARIGQVKLLAEGLTGILKVLHV